MTDQKEQKATEKFTRIDSVIANDPEFEKKQRDKTTFNQQVVDMDANFAHGTLEITDDIAAKAKRAVTQRINSTKKYTEERLEQVKKNRKQYDSDISVASDAKSLSEIFMPETFNAVEDATDDFSLIFKDLAGDLEIKDIGETLERFIVQKLALSEGDDDKTNAFLRSLLIEAGHADEIEDEDFFFKTLDVIKSLIKRGVIKSGYSEKIETFLRDGTISGMFILKDKWATTGAYKLTGKEGSREVDLDEESFFRFTPVDSRMMIFPQHAMDWSVEMIPTAFHDLLNITLDENGKPKKGARYDIKMLEHVAARLKNVGASAARKETDTSGSINPDDPEIEVSNLYDETGNITVYEAHQIPLNIKGGGKRANIYMCSFVNLAAKDSDGLDLVLIGVQKTPHVAGNAYLHTTFFEKDNDIAGKGLPEVIFPLQKIINGMASHSMDIMNIGLWGIMVINNDAFKDTEELNNLTPRKILRVKNLKGRELDSVLKWLHPPTDSINSMGELFNLFQDALKRTTRNGPTGEKIAPNPSATEFQAIVDELQKSVSKTAMRLNNILGKWLERLYTYNMLMMKDTIKMKVQGHRITDLNKLEQKEDDPDFDKVAKFKTSEKTIDITAEELFSDGLEFKLIAVDTFDLKAVEKQQALQLTNLLFSLQVINNEDGTPHVMTDETGAQVIIRDYTVLKKLFDAFDVKDMFDKPKADAPMALGENPAVPGAGGQPAAQGGPAVPPLDASTAPTDIAQQATTLNPGIEV